MTFAAMSLETQETVRACDGRKLPVRAWRPLAPVRAVVVICHDQSRRRSTSWASSANRLVDAGSAVYVLGVRGCRQPVLLAAIRADLDDLATVIDWVAAQEPDRRIFLVGDHVARGMVRIFALRRRAELAGLFGGSPVYDIPLGADAVGGASGPGPDLRAADANPAEVSNVLRSQRDARWAMG
jgi:alpha-beta hydrolase superfamily lysophospholipase